jgi:hypothetical protein
MADFPRTTVGGVSVSRLVIGVNWFFGWSHTSAAKDKLIKSDMTEARIADIIATFLAAGVDTLIGPPLPQMKDIFARAENKAGRKIIPILTPNFPLDPRNPVKSDDARKALDLTRDLGAKFCLPHQCVVDALLDKLYGKIRHWDELAPMIRERGMIPGLSTHAPEAIVIADKTGADVETYISIYNAAGFLMPVEADWVMRVISEAKKPVLTIKPLAAGKLLPPVGLAFVWNTIRACDMVAVGTMTPDEAKEVIELSLDFINRRIPTLQLQETRSKKALKKDKK